MGILGDMFQLEIPTVHSIISKMIINEELMVSAPCCPPNTCNYGLKSPSIPCLFSVCSEFANCVQ